MSKRDDENKKLFRKGISFNNGDDAPHINIKLYAAQYTQTHTEKVRISISGICSTWSHEEDDEEPK